MGKYTVFVDVGKTIVDILKDQLVPEPLEKPENIGICSPNDRGSFTVGIHMYDYMENTNFGPMLPQQLPNGYTRLAPTSFKIMYFISVASKAEVLIRTAEETRILGRVLQILKDNENLPTEFMPPALKNSGDKPKIKVVSKELEEKIKIWSMYNEPYRQSIFFEVSPVTLESAVVLPPAGRVKTFGVDAQNTSN